MSSSEVEAEVEVGDVSDENAARAPAAAPPPPPPPIEFAVVAAAVAAVAAGFSGSQPVQSLTASCPAALAGLFANHVTLSHW